ncbi:PAS domain-containing sensor histidine kinase [Methanonatronarchaeum sp. AMET-Sl]|uniref:PAS domain-containing sensor histidine kinase n=1 Tax=Methanonatronarchaeum sp. AMET-Sl TaxID=3037654 RepID=UPI00244E1DA7|nr:PAS domain-containing sensor histidine kinase [Methanonatronarchaeum sp. AMET-Sl]WGI16925.1 PAS domain-containing sensor histidine kinase [Methanonatronarchaeum sp. AMET-Sl]
MSKQNDLIKLSSMVMDSVNDHIAIIDSDGEIILVNEAWKNFGDQNDLQHNEYCLGENYIEISRDVDEENSAGKHVADEIQKVLKGKKQSSQIEYPCHSPKTKRWFICEITPIELDEKYAVIKHINITKRKKAEEWAEFMRSTMNHDLKNKIQLMEGYIDLLQEKLKNPGKTEQNYLNKVKTSIEDTKKLIKKIQDIEGVKKEEVGPTKIQPVIWESIKQYENNLEENNITLNKNISDCTVKAGPLLKEVFKNLITNSIKHAECNEIKIKTTTQKNKCKITYQDNGKGIPNQLKEKVFEKGVSSQGGSGLGLYLCKKIINRYDGEIELKNNKGAKFEITLNKK